LSEAQAEIKFVKTVTMWLLKKAQYFLYNVLQEELKNDARLMEWRLKNARR